MFMFISLFILGAGDTQEVVSFLDCKNQTLCDPQNATGHCSDGQVAELCVMRFGKVPKPQTLKK
jgi:hypothetical protein